MAKISTIEELAYQLKHAKERNLPSPIVFLGAGASKTGLIPLAGEIVEEIKNRYRENPKIKKLPDRDKTYLKLMECLNPSERDPLLKEFIEKAKINVTHLYLAHLMKMGYVDYVLTVNFDNLMLRALSLYNISPPTYDMAVLKDLTTTNFKEKSVIYLHGQHHGLWLLNTDEEMRKVKDIIPKIFNKITNQRPWVVIGYSGEDPIFDHIASLGRFDHGMFWITYKDNTPSNKVMDGLIEKSNTNASLIKGYDADSFMMTLNSELQGGQPQIYVKPFSCLKDLLSNIIDIDDVEPFKGLKERSEMAKRDVEAARQQYEENKPAVVVHEKDQLKINPLKKRLLDIIANEEYKKKNIDIDLARIESEAKNLSNSEILNLLSDVFFNWGTTLAISGSSEKDPERFLSSLQKFAKATDLNPKNDSAYCNWGTALSDLAKIKTDEKLFQLSFEKFKLAIDLNPKDDFVYNNWGTALYNLAKIKTDENLFQLSFEKFKLAIDLNPKNDLIYCYWGNALYNLAKIKTDENLFQLSFEKFKLAIDLNPKNDSVYCNWGSALYDLAKIKSDEKLFELSFEKFKLATDLNPKNNSAYYNWGNVLYSFAIIKADEKLFQLSFEKFKLATDLNPKDDSAYFNWGHALYQLAKIKGDEKLFELSFEKFKLVTDLNPKNESAYSIWGNALYSLAKIKGDDKLFQLSFEKFKLATDLNPKNDLTYFNWGIALADLAKINKDERLFELCFEKFKITTDLNPKNDSAYCNWGSVLYDLAKIKGNPNLFEQSLAKYKLATDLNPKNDLAYFNWGTTLCDLAKIKVDENLFKLSIEKFKIAADLNPKSDFVYNNWGSTLIYLYKINKDENIINLAIAIGFKTVELGASSYNLACAYALKQEKELALQTLETCLTKKELSIKEIKEDDDWKNFLQDSDFIALLDKYSK
jgi:hypothetical protein